MAERVWQFVVEVPLKAGPEVADAVYTALADAADAAQPDDRDGWDIFVYGTQVDVADEAEIAEFADEIGLT